MKEVISSYLLTVLLLFTGSCFAQFPQKSSKPDIQLASRYTADVLIKQYLVSEKLDGVRARWTGKQLITRGGFIISAPQWFIRDFPSQILDGELWIARNRFDEVSAIVRRKSIDHEKWQLITFNVFDLPLSSQPFALRYSALKQLIDDKSSRYITVIRQKSLETNLQLNQWLDTLEAQKGEGLMLHHKEALYEHKRSKYLLKLKKVYDAEATIIAHIEGKGKFKGMLGAMLMEKDNGVQFKLGSGFSDELRRNPPPIGAVVTYQYYGLTKKGKPRFASFLRLRVSE